MASAIVPLITIDRHTRAPVHRQIYDAYRAAIVGRRLRPSQRVPSSRTLAAELGISRMPVLNAYDQLRAEGYFESRVGAGTRVCSTLPELPSFRQRSIGTLSGPRPVASRASTAQQAEPTPWVRGWGSFGVGQVAFEHFPIQIWSRLVARHSRTATIDSVRYSDQMGLPGFRDTVATYLRTSRGVSCEARQVMIVSGSQQALDITARVLLDKGSGVWLEDPGYTYARDVLAMTGCKLVPVPIDAEGLDVAAGIRLNHKARAAFVTPSHQYPLGVTMSASRRLQLLDWAQSVGAWIIEDDYDNEYRYDGMPISSLQGLDDNARVIYIGTFSKVLYPSLRLGYIVIPPDLIDRFCAVRRVMDIAPPSFYQSVVADFIREGHFARHIRRMRTLYRERRGAVVKSIREEVDAEVIGAEAGVHISVLLGKKCSDVECSQRAARDKLWLWPLSPCYAGKPLRQGFILGYGSTPVEQVRRAVQKISSVLKSN
ncbi:MAG TPA: PLP-dependent aminotransferase family protein [Candidatus Angelobacter sp.]|nr:PLP-dependent aminotransferase family protein [Candidatus Angelobacter sp.]